MIITDRGRFKLTFENGYTVSVINGFGSYSDNLYNTKLILGKKPIISEDCEIAIIKNEEFCTKKFIDNGDDVKGYVLPDELAEIILKVANYQEKWKDTAFYKKKKSV